MIPCPRCGAAADPRLLSPSTFPLYVPAARALARRDPAWRPNVGLCPACALDAAREFARRRSAFPLHTRTEPHTTFPYYHPDEETVLGLAERLPAHDGYDGRDVTLGFLDSGFYPHPDLISGALPAGVAWERLTPRQWRATLEQVGTRLSDYIDLSGDRDERGLQLASLWDGQGVAWHGQMTTVIAAGSGALSGGRYRGFASGACVLPIKIGRGDGRIPERDILEGFEWLLRERRWERLGVRIVNVSVGGDFPQDWRVNAVCRAAEALAARGVLIVAAAGNSPVEHLLAPAQAPSILTVGGIDDHNLFIDARSAGRERLALYHHSYERVLGLRGPLRKPELLAPAAWLPGPILPVSPVFREMQAIDRLRRSLRATEGDDLVAHWQRVLHHEAADEEEITGEWMGEVWQAVRKRMNTHKWVHACYQHVDGTSVAAAVVSGVAAQMVQANPNLSAQALRALLCATALPLDHLLPEKRGAGLIQPAAAVAAALRAPGGRLAGLPQSGTVVRQNELQKWVDAGRVSRSAAPEEDGRGHALYVGLDAPDAARVFVTGSFSQWRTDAIPLERTERGWWQGAIPLRRGEHPYRFWVERADGSTRWLPDPENPLRIESGYADPQSGCIAYHSLAVIL